MKTLLLAAALALTTLTASAIEENFTDAGPLDCGQIKTCRQTTSDQHFTLAFRPAYPWSGPSPAGFEVRQQTIELRNANGGLLDLGIMSVNLTGSSAYNGSTFIGAIRLDVQDAAGAWSPASQWSSWVGSPLGIYVVFSGHNAQSPLVRGVRAVRLTAVNGATAFRIGMMNLTAY